MYPLCFSPPKLANAPHILLLQHCEGSKRPDSAILFADYNLNAWQKTINAWLVHRAKAQHHCDHSTTCITDTFSTLGHQALNQIGDPSVDADWHSQVQQQVPNLVNSRQQYSIATTPKHEEHQHTVEEWIDIQMRTLVAFEHSRSVVAAITIPSHHLLTQCQWKQTMYIQYTVLC
jgi:hypothetical protein